jgi:ABC-2 type transport system ATP-binding protein
MTEVAISVAGVRHRYGQLLALDELDLQVAPGEIFGLVGANGAGKTTLIKILVGILRPETGTVRVLGLDPVRDAVALRAQIGYMPQTPALYDDLTASENLRFFAAAHAGARAATKLVDAALREVGLLDRQNDLFHTLSGGMKQRLSLACALLRRPRLLLLDEPTTGVDPSLRARLWSYLRARAAAGATVLLSTHQMDEVGHCDRVAIIRNGRVLACDTPGRLLARGAATVTLWRDGAPEEHRLYDYPEELPSLLGLQQVTRLEVALPSLEDIVLDLIAAQERRRWEQEV